MCEKQSADSFTALFAPTERRLNQEWKHLTKRLIKARGLDNISSLEPIFNLGLGLIFYLSCLRRLVVRFALVADLRFEVFGGRSRRAQVRAVCIKSSLIFECNPLFPQISAQFLQDSLPRRRKMPQSTIEVFRSAFETRDDCLHALCITMLAKRSQLILQQPPRL
jgi:hypothetical protein